MIIPNSQSGPVDLVAGPMARLTILIPTYNRASFLRMLLHQLIPQAAKARLPVKILVVDNASSDDTAELVTRLARTEPILSLFRRDEHVGSGEENYLLALPQCRSEFVWTLSDDDNPTADAVDRILDELERDGGIDFLLSNVSTISVQGEILKPRVIMEEGFPDVAGIQALIANVGFVTIGACFSAAVFRKSLIDKVPVDRFLAASPIYSHVAIFLAAFQKARCRFVERPFIRYRYENTPQSAWAAVSRKHDRQSCFPWTLGIARLFNLLEELEITPASSLGHMCECGEGEGVQWHFASFTIQSMCEQLQRWIDTRDPRERVTAQEIATMRPLYVDAGFAPAHALEQLIECVDFLNAVWPEKPSKPLRYSGETLGLGSVLDACDPGPRNDMVNVWLTACRQRIATIRVECDMRITKHTDPRVPGYVLARLGPRIIAFPEAATPRSGQIFPLLLESDPRTVWGQTVDDILHAVEPIRQNDKALLTSRPPVAASVEEDFSECLSRFGLFFNAKWYANQSGPPSHVETFDAGIKDIQHFKRVGSRCGWSPNPWFDESWYLLRYPEAREMTLAGDLMSGFHHYMRYGYALGLDPGPRFHERAYLAANPDVSAAVADAGNGFRCGLEHWLAHGLQEGRGPLGQPRRLLQPA